MGAERARGLLAWTLALAGLHLAVWTARSALGSQHGNLPPRGAIVEAAGGPIEDLAIQFHRDGAEAFLAVYEELLGALRPETTVRVVVADATDERIFEEARQGWFGAGGGPRVTYVQTGRPITSWARDRMAVLGDGRRAILLAPPQPHIGPEQRAHDWLVPWALRRSLAERGAIRTTAFGFEGGDLIADERHVFVATPLMERNPETDPERLLRDVSDATGRPAVHIGGPGRPVPDHHIGMFLTPLGGGRVLYGDPDAAFEALRSGGALPAPDATGRMTLQVGGEPLEIDLSEARFERFRNVGRILRQRGFEAVPMPILPAADRWVFLSYDNVLMERREDGLHVLLPVYGVPALDDAAVEVWQRVGARVHRIDVTPVFRLGGSVRCLVAPLRRHDDQRPG